MKRVEHLLLASYLLPILSGTRGVASASFLEITPDAQSADMTGTELAITDNEGTTIFYSVSIIALSQDIMSASYSYADISRDSGIYSASFSYRIGREGRHGFSVGLHHYKDTDFHWQDGVEDHTRAWNVEAAYSRNVAKNLSLSLTLRYLQVKAYRDADNRGPVSADPGTSYHRNMGILSEMASWTIGFQAANLGNKLDGQRSPARLGLGGAIDLLSSMDNRLQTIPDFSYLLPSEYRHFQIGIGTEYNSLKYGITYGGYHLGDSDKEANSYGTLGCGISFWPICTDPSHALANKNCFTHKTWQPGIGTVFQAFPSGGPPGFIIEQNPPGSFIEQSAVFSCSAVCQAHIQGVASLRPQVLHVSVPDEEKWRLYL